MKSTTEYGGTSSTSPGKYAESIYTYLSFSPIVFDRLNQHTQHFHQLYGHWTSDWLYLQEVQFWNILSPLPTPLVPGIARTWWSWIESMVTSSRAFDGHYSVVFSWPEHFFIIWDKLSFPEFTPVVLVLYERKNHFSTMFGTRRRRSACRDVGLSLCCVLVLGCNH